jgi:hypothetical protein
MIVAITMENFCPSSECLRRGFCDLIWRTPSKEQDFWGCGEPKDGFRSFPLSPQGLMTRCITKLWGVENPHSRNGWHWKTISHRWPQSWMSGYLKVYKYISTSPNSAFQNDFLIYVGVMSPQTHLGENVRVKTHWTHLSHWRGQLSKAARWGCACPPSGAWGWLVLLPGLLTEHCTVCC